MPAATASHLADRSRLASLRASGTSAGRATSRPGFSLADVISLPGAPVTPRALDAPKVQSNNRLYLPACLEALGWSAGQQVRVWVNDAVAVLTAGPTGRGSLRTVGSGERMTVPAGTITALGARPGDYLVAFVPPDEAYLLLLGPAALLRVADLLILPAHVRTLVGRLRELDVVGARAVERLADKLSGSELAALAEVSIERLRELGVLDQVGDAEEVR